MASKSAWPFVLVLVVCLPPLLLGSYGVDVVSEIIIFAIVAMSLDFILGYGGLVSFGHAAYFGIGAYTTMLLCMKLGVGPWLAMLSSVAISAVAAGLIGLVCVRASGTGFFMLTLAFAQLLYAGAVKWRFFTGGSDGIGGLARPHLFGLDLSNSTIMYAVAGVFLLAVWLFFTMLVRSPYGHVLIGLRESTMRMTALGYAERPVKLVALMISGAIAGLGGSLYAFYNGFVSPDTFSWGMSGTFLLMVILGGRASLIGPVIGAAIFLTMKNLVSSHTDHWLLIVGCVFVGCVMFFPDGVYGLLKRREGRPE
jgi:branched-chain amino acid transport system permease protein